MGWWRIGGETEEVIGDGPADAVASLLARIPASGILDFLDALAAAARRIPGYDAGRITLLLGDGRRLSSQDNAANDALRETMEGVLKAVTVVYQNDLERPPTLREVLEVFEFVLRPEPERYLRGMKDVRISMITAEPS